MNSVCGICSLGINEGSICRECRVNFSSLSINVYNYNKCLECEYCDIYDFPCLQCAQYVFDGVLGRGNGTWEEMSEEGYNINNNSNDIIMDVEDMIRILRDKKNIIVEGFESSEISCEEISEISCEEISEISCEEISEISSEEISEISSEEISEISSAKNLYKLKSLINQAEDSINRKEDIIKLKKEIISKNKEDAVVVLEYIKGKYELSELSYESLEESESELSSDSYLGEEIYVDTKLDKTEPVHIISKSDQPKKKGYYSWVKGGVKKILFM